MIFNLGWMIGLSRGEGGNYPSPTYKNTFLLLLESPNGIDAISH